MIPEMIRKPSTFKHVLRSGKEPYTSGSQALFLTSVRLQGRDHVDDEIGSHHRQETRISAVQRAALTQTTGSVPFVS
jgi:hypothetical protein